MNTLDVLYSMTLLIFASLAYRNLLFDHGWEGFAEHWDDRWNFVDNPQVTEPLSWDVFVRMCTTSRINVWEPLAVLLKNVVHHFFHSAQSQRCVTLFFHALNGVMLYHLLLRVLTFSERHHQQLPQSPQLPQLPQPSAESMKLSTACFIASAIWVVHPLHAEVVGWASVQPYAPAVFFSLLSLYAYLSLLVASTTSPRTMALQSVFLFGCGLMFKSVVLPLAPIGVIALELGLGTSITNFCAHKFRLYCWVALIAVAVVVGMISMTENEATDTDMVVVNGWERCVKANSMVWMYIRNTMWPTKLRPHTRLAGDRGDGNHAYNLQLTPHARGSTLAAMYTCIVSCLCFFSSSKLFQAVVLYVWCCFLPTTGIIQHGMVQAGGDRYAYVPSLCLPFVIAAYLRCLQGRKSVFAYCLCSTLLLFSASELCNQQVQIWKNDETMMKYSLQVDPRDWRALATLIDVRRERGQEISELVTRALDVMPIHLTPGGRLRIKVALSRARLLVFQSKVDDACELYESCVVGNLVDGDNNAKIMALVNTAVCRATKMQRNKGDTSEVESVLERAVLLATESRSTELRIAAAAQGNLRQFREWQSNGFVGQIKMDLLF